MKVKFYAALREVVGNKEIDVAIGSRDTVRAVLRRIAGEHPELGRKLWDENEVMKGYVKVLKTGRDIQHLEGLDTPVTDADNLSLFPPVGGG